MSRARDLADGTFSGTVTADDILLSDADTPTLTLTDTTNTLSTFVQSGNSTAVIGTSTNHDLRFFTNNSEKARILSGGGITFNGDTAAANALDDYEEGSWSPTIIGDSGASGQAYATQIGKYTKIGRFCHLTFDMRASTIGTLSGTYVVIGGLPFTPVSSNIGGSITVGYSSGWSGLADPHITAYINGSDVYLMNGSNDYIRIGDGNAVNNSRLIGSMFLLINE